MMGIIGTVSALALLLLTGFGAVKWALKKDTKIENRRRAAAELASTLKSYGLVRTPDFLINYSVGDYSGMGESLIQLTKLFLSGEEAVVKEFKQVFERCLEVKLRDEEGRAYIAMRLEQADKVAVQEVV